MQLQISGKISNQRILHLIRSADDPLAHDGPNVIRNLTGSPKRISPVYVYDRLGTDLFERQCTTPEYYLRRVETQLMKRYAGDIIGLCGALPIIELGAGTAEKTRILFAEYVKRGMRCDYFPIDIDTETLSELAVGLVSAFPRLYVHCAGATYQAGLSALPTCEGARLFAFLGSSIGNMEWPEIDALLWQLFDCSVPGDFFLLGADLDKDPDVIDRAYNDSAGYGPRSTLNMLHHLNRRYGGNFAVENFRYRSKYDSRAKKNEVRIESLADQTVTLGTLGFTVSFSAAELIEAEVMLKFDPDELTATLDRAGFSMQRHWIDPVYRYGLFLMRRQ